MSDDKDDIQEDPTTDDEGAVIKDPIYDIMTEEEAQESFDRIMKLAEEKERQNKPQPDEAE